MSVSGAAGISVWAGAFTAPGAGVDGAELVAGGTEVPGGAEVTGAEVMPAFLQSAHYWVWVQHLSWQLS